ncbi:MAG TPA: hypothetical protein VJB13_03690 [Candidatus Nanoarchaeia archaeon]|nr:hypothetical protein [Candidatus Nanoarchaeia archaeon]
MDALVQKHYLQSRGFVYVGDSAEDPKSPYFDEDLFYKLQDAKIEKIPAFERTSAQYLYLGSKEKKLEGVFSFYAILPEEEEEKIPDTLREGQRVPAPVQKNSLEAKTIIRRLPSKLLRELDQLNVLYENVQSFHFKSKRQLFPHTLSLDDLLTLSRMENSKNPLDYSKLLNKTVSEEDRKARKSLDHGLRNSPLVQLIGRNLYVLSQEARSGRYAAVVDAQYLPENYRV